MSPSPMWQALHTLNPRQLDKALRAGVDVTQPNDQGLTALEYVVRDPPSAEQLNVSESMYDDERWAVMNMLLRTPALLAVPRDRYGQSLFCNALSVHVGEFIDGISSWETSVARVAVWLTQVVAAVPVAEWEQDLAGSWAEVVSDTNLDHADNRALAQGLLQLAFEHGAHANAFLALAEAHELDLFPDLVARDRREQATVTTPTLSARRHRPRS